LRSRLLYWVNAAGLSLKSLREALPGDVA
jgi:hypothetical protein